MQSNDGAFAREKELLKQIECLTKEMTEARKETGKLHIATHCNTLQHSVTHRNTTAHCNTMHHTATRLIKAITEARKETGMGWLPLVGSLKL